MALSKQDKLKLTNAGFQFLRVMSASAGMESMVYTIKMSTEAGGWEVLSKEIHKKEHEAILAKILQNPKTILEP